MSKPIRINLSLGQKLSALTATILLGILFALYLFYQGLAASVMQEKITQSRSLSDAGLSIIQYFHSNAQTLRLEESEAKEMAINALESMRYGDNGYFWINDRQGVVLMHPFVTDLLNSNQINMQDIKGNFLFRDIIKTAVEGGGQVEYFWPKPTIATPFQKVSHVVYFEPWDWVLGTGLYFEDIERDIRNYAIAALCFGFVFSVVLVMAATMVTKKMMYQLEDMAIIDALTTLHTRRYLLENIDNMVARHERQKEFFLTAIFLDIDHFKKINDNFGHANGDKVLSNVGKMIRQVSRPDDLSVRYGGEEFVILVLDKDEQAALHLAERICHTAKHTVFNKDKQKFNVTLSAGIAHRLVDESIFDTLQRADENLYKAKTGGRNRIISS